MAVSIALAEPIPVAADSVANWAMMLMPRPVSKLSMIAPPVSLMLGPTPAQSAVTVTLPRCASPLLLALTMLSSTSPSPRSVMFPSWDWTIEPSCITTRPAVPASTAVPLYPFCGTPVLKSVLALSKTSPEPAALMVTAASTSIESPA